MTTGDGHPERLGPAAARLVEEVAGLGSAALPLAAGLRALAEEVPGRRFRRAATALADRIEAGEPLDEVLTAVAGRFPDHVRELMATGCRTGRLGPALGEFVAARLMSADLRRGLLLGLLYPTLLTTLCLGYFLALFLWIVPQFQAIFDDFNMSLPWLTQVVLGVTNRIDGNGGAVLIKGLAGLVAIAVAWLVLLDARSRRWFIRRVPFFGAVGRWATQAEFCRVLAVLLDAEIPAGRALVLAANATSDAELAYEAGRASRSIGAGMPLGMALRGASALPPGAVDLLEWAGGGPAIGESLRVVADLLAAQARARAEVATRVVAVLVTISILWAVILTVVAIFLPLIQLISRLSG